MPDQRLTIPASLPVSAAFSRDLPNLPTRGGGCIKPARVGGQLRPCRQCTSCAYAEALRKANLLKGELDPVRPSFFLTLTYSPAGLAEHLVVPAKAEGELTAEQEHLRKKWARRIWLLGEKLRNTEPGTRHAQSLQARIDYRQERLDRFLEAASRPLPERVSIDRGEGKLWQKRFREELRKDDPEAKLPRMVLKYELGSKATRRPHIHVLMLHPTPRDLEAAILAWGHLFIPEAAVKAARKGLPAPQIPPIPSWRALMSAPKGRGHVHVLPVDDEGVSTYVTKDLYRGQDATASEYIANGISPPAIQWPRNPGIGCGGWMDYLVERFVENREVYGFSDVELELTLQDTRHKAQSLRHRVQDVRPSRMHHGERVPAVVVWATCPPSVWRRFLKRIEDERDPLVRQTVTDALGERDAAIDSDVGREFKRRHQALNRAFKRLGNWEDLCRRKLVKVPTYAERERAFLNRRLAQLRGGQVAALSFPDEQEGRG